MSDMSNWGKHTGLVSRGIDGLGNNNKESARLTLSAVISRVFKASSTHQQCKISTRPPLPRALGIILLFITCRVGHYKITRLGLCFLLLVAVEPHPTKEKNIKRKLRTHGGALRSFLGKAPAQTHTRFAHPQQGRIHAGRDRQEAASAAVGSETRRLTAGAFLLGEPHYFFRIPPARTGHLGVASTTYVVRSSSSTRTGNQSPLLEEDGPHHPPTATRTTHRHTHE